MPRARPRYSILLPEKKRFTGQVFSPNFKNYANKFTVCDALAAGELEQLRRHVQVFSTHWPIAALCRDYEYRDARDWQWLRADPIFVQAEMQGARVMAWDNLALDLEHKKAVLSSLRALFGDFGYELSLSAQQFFYLRVAPGAPLPEFIAAPDVLGGDLFENLSKDKKWLSVFNECQIILHNHPINQQRQARGQLPINGLWFWGQGALPHDVRHAFSSVETDNFELKALTARVQPVLEAAHTLLDLRTVRDWSLVEAVFDKNANAVFDFSDGSQWWWQASRYWHFWRRHAPKFS